MKSIILASSLALSNIALAANEPIEFNTAENFDIPKSTDIVPDLVIQEINPSKVSYIKLGASLVYGELGFGRRYFDYDHHSARDHSLNLYPIGFVLPGGVISYKYSILNYQKGPSLKKYSGFGLELGVSVPYVAPIPNIELIWGRQLDQKNMSNWIQVGVNLLPVGAGVVLIAIGGHEHGTWNNAGPLLVLATAMSAVTITYAF